MGGRDLWGDGWTLLLKQSSSKTPRGFGSEVAARGLPSFSAQPPIKHAWCRKYAQVLWLCLSFLHFVPKLIYWIYSDIQRKADFLWIKEWHRQLWQTHAIIRSLLSLHLPGGAWQGGGLRRCIALNSKSYWAIAATPSQAQGFVQYLEAFLIELFYWDHVIYNLFSVICKQSFLSWFRFPVVSRRDFTALRKKDFFSR